MFEFLFGGKQKVSLIRDLVGKRLGLRAAHKMGKAKLLGTPEAAIVTIISTVVLSQSTGGLLMQIFQHMELHRRKLGMGYGFDQILELVRTDQAYPAILAYVHYRLSIEQPGKMTDEEINSAVKYASLKILSWYHPAGESNERVENGEESANPSAPSEWDKPHEVNSSDKETEPAVEDKYLFLRATEEVDNGSVNAALWATAMALKEGNEDQAKYEYIRLRVEELKSKSDEELDEEDSRREEEIREREDVKAKKAFEKKHEEFFRLVSELEKIQHKVLLGASSPLQGPWRVREPRGFEVECKTRDKFNQYAKGRVAWAKEKGITGRVKEIEEKEENLPSGCGRFFTLVFYGVWWFVVIVVIWLSSGP